MISGPAMWKNFAELSSATARASRVFRCPAGRGAAPPGRIDAEPLEQLGMAQGSSTISRRRVDRVAHAAEIVVGDVGAALAVAAPYIAEAAGPLSFRRCGRCPGELPRRRRAQLLQREAAPQELTDVVGHVGVDPLVPGGRDGVALDQRTPGERGLQRIGRNPGAGRSAAPAQRRSWSPLGLRPCGLDEIARAGAGVGALEAVETDDVDVLVLAVRADRAAAVERCRRSRSRPPRKGRARP